MSVPDLLGAASGVLLDFDGPICSVFGGTGDRPIANSLRAFAEAHSIALTRDGLDSSDPLTVLRAIASGAPSLLSEANSVLTRAECFAISTAVPTPGAAEFIMSFSSFGKPIAIVSNNSTRSIVAYLAAKRLQGYVAHVQGRSERGPSDWKPSPLPVLAAVAALGLPTDRVVMIGDSVTDIEACNLAGVLAVGFVNRPPKAEALRAAGAVALVKDMHELLR